MVFLSEQTTMLTTHKATDDPGQNKAEISSEKTDDKKAKLSISNDKLQTIFKCICHLFK